MSNTVQIKRGIGQEQGGKGAPPDGSLAPYELGINIIDGQLYFGGPIEGDKYGAAQGIKVAKAEGAIKIVDENGSECSVGSSAGPIYLSNGKFLPCGGDATIPGTIDYAKALNPGATIVTDLEKNNAATFTGAENSQTIVGATGVLPVSKGGTGATTADAARTNLGLTKSNLVDLVYPIGSIYMSVNSTSPGTLFGGTWEAITGRFLLAQNSKYDAYKAGEMGGSVTTTLTVNNLPSHSHSGIYYTNDSNVTSQVSFNNGSQGYKLDYGKDDAAADTASRFKTGNTGKGTSFSIMPPYLAVYVWKRTA